ncbi:hypothetical protein J6590_084928 [Homalodisca vitripennis]|nr:hypothetical protein J6590_084928 [Homalodisca vitripennis]
MESLILRDHMPFEQHLPVIPLFEWPFRPPAILRNTKKKQAHKSHRKICNVRTLSSKDSVMKAAQFRDTAKTIVARIGFEHDLVTAEAKYHNDCLVQLWLGNQLDPEQWGWKHVNNALEPTHTLLPPAPEKLLNSVSATAKRACTTCQGQSCSNVESPTEEGFYMNDETTDVSLLGQFMSTQEDEEEEENREREEDGGEEEEIISDDDDE